MFFIPLKISEKSTQTNKQNSKLCTKIITINNKCKQNKNLNY